MPIEAGNWRKSILLLRLLRHRQYPQLWFSAAIALQGRGLYIFMRILRLQSMAKCSVCNDAVYHEENWPFSSDASTK